MVVRRTKALPVPICDKSDIPVLSEAVVGDAEVLVTGDRDLLEIAVAPPLPILTPRGLWEQLRDRER